MKNENFLDNLSPEFVYCVLVFSEVFVLGGINVLVTNPNPNSKSS
jgi:hypothetical protein